MLNRILMWMVRFPVLLRPVLLAAGRLSRRRALGLFGHVLLMLVLAAAVTASAGWLLWSLAGRPDMREWGGAGDVVKTALTVTAGLGAVVALVVAYRRQRHLESAERREDTKLFNERFKGAAEQLGSAEPAVRLAGVYAMAGLADDWDGGRQTCVNVLCAYMRMPYTPPGQKTETRSEREARLREREVRHAILDSIRERLRLVRSPWGGCRFDFRGAVIEGLDFAGIHMRGGSLHFASVRFTKEAVHLAAARFDDCLVNFTGAVFTGVDVRFDLTCCVSTVLRLANVRAARARIDFTGAAFFDSTLDLEGATTSDGGLIDVSCAEFTGGRLEWESPDGTPSAGLRLPPGYTEPHRP